MKNKTIRNTTIALVAFVLWGNLVSLLLPAEQFVAVMKTVDFATVLFSAAALVYAVCGMREEASEHRK